MLMRTAHNAADSASWQTKVRAYLFPVNSHIAIRTILPVWFAYFAIILVTEILAQSNLPQLSIFEALSVTGVAIIGTWALYRLIADMDTPSALLCLTLPAVILAFLTCYISAYFTAYQPLTGFPWLGFKAVLFIYLFLAAWSGLYLALVSMREVREAYLRARTFEKTSRESQLRALRYQLNPHFVFNALNSVSSLIVDDKNREAEQLVDGLADYMRTVLGDDGEKITTVTEEIAQQARYLEIEKIRFPDRLGFDLQIEPAAGEWKIPALILQPLVENAIKYGVSQSSDPVHIAITAAQEGDHLKLRVENTGRMHVSEAPVTGTGTGLSNIREQLAAVYGSAASLTVGNGPKGTVVSTIYIPDKRLIFQDL